MLQKFLLGAMILTLSTFCFAQSDFNRGEFFGGYSNAQVETGNSNNNNNSFTGTNNFQDFFNRRESFNGFDASGVYNFSRYVGAKVDFSGNYKTYHFNVPNSATSNTTDRYRVRQSVYNYLGGIQVKDNSKGGSRIRPFAHVLIGGATGRSDIETSFFSSNFCRRTGVNCQLNFSDSDSGFAAALGGGLDVRASNRVSIRAFQIDYNPTHIGNFTQDNVRFGFGVVLH